VTVPDLYDETGQDATRTVALDPKRSPRENADAYFERARKARDARDYADGRAADLQAELADLRALQAEAERADDEVTRERLRGRPCRHRRRESGGDQPAPPRQRAHGQREKPFGGHRVRTYTVDGYELLVGETAEANDFLVTRASAPGDLWLHVRAGTGAHGILRTQSQPGRGVPDPTIRRAAAIVAARSGKGVKHAGLVPVDVTERRYVRKPRGAKPGLVAYERERTLDVEPTL
jgi:predicted ribosome quality control (RQC) complex YloA/Tae2 family protein